MKRFGTATWSGGLREGKGKRFLAKRMNATSMELDAGHLSLVSHPKEIANPVLAVAGRRN